MTMKLKENKEEKKKEETKEEEKKEENKEEEPPEIVLKVDMHCEACARKVARALKGFEGVIVIIIIIINSPLYSSHIYNKSSFFSPLKSLHQNTPNRYFQITWK